MEHNLDEHSICCDCINETLINDKCYFIEINYKARSQVYLKFFSQNAKDQTSSI